MVVALLAVFALAAAAPWLHRTLHARTGWVLALLPSALALFFATHAGRVADGEAVTAKLDWTPSLDVTFSFYLDGLSLVFALLITGIGALVLVYADGYLAGHPDLGRLHAFLLLFMGSMLGLVLADNVFTLFVFWELTSISSYLLIGFEHERSDARASALQALLVTGTGGLAMLAGFVLLGQIGGSFELSTLAGQGEAIRADGRYLPVLLLLLAGAFTKSAQVPFHFWLPGAMVAPTPVSAYLHSATMVKAGVYLLARLSPTLGGTSSWTVLVTTTGAVTMLVGGYLALCQSDLKRILAYSTVSALGILTLLLGLGNPYAATAAIVFLLAHALYKGALFMVAGAVDHETGTRDVDRLGGLYRAMPITAAVAALAAVSLAGFGPVLSFIGKELLLEAVLTEREARYLLVPAVVLASALLVAVAGIAGVRPFLGHAGQTPKHPHEAPLSMWLGPALLAVLGLVLGVAPSIVERTLVAPATTAVLGERSSLHLALWHGVNPALLLSVVSIVAGTGIYFGRTPLRRAALHLEAALPWGPERGYNLTLTGLNALARGQTRLLQNGYLRLYLIVTIGTTVALAGYTLASRGAGMGTRDLDGVRFYQIGLAAVILLAALTAALSPSRLAAVAALGVVGYGVALIYILFGAPDLAMTQFMIETLTVILFVLVFYHLPRLRLFPGGLTRARDAAIALAGGGLMTALVLTVNANRAESHVAAYYAELSKPLAHGRNIVNVILVDFRALDTLGEITVLAVAAFGVFALLRLRADAAAGPQDHTHGSTLSPARWKGGPMTSLILQTATRPLLTLLLLFAIFLLLRGHNEPGGGFVGGLVAAAAFALHAIAFGPAAARRMVRVKPRTLIGVGLLTAAGSGLIAMLAGEPFLTGQWGSVQLLGLPAIDLGTPLLFDVGVFLTVLGVTLTVILTLAEE
jgi:multicomponent Na+:H+ antiporter subunit A